MTKRPFLKLAAGGVLALGLSGCISLLPKSEPAQLYRFGAAPAVATTDAPAPADSVGVFRAGGVFQREASGDRILTLTGQKAAYIAQARWVAPAEVLFDEAVANAFETASGRVRLVSRGEPSRSGYVLRLDVRNFETRYDGARPTVLVRVRAVLAHSGTQPQITEKIFEASVPAGQNRITAIAAAYDKALGQVLGELVAWTNGSVA